MRGSGDWWVSLIRGAGLSVKRVGEMRGEVMRRRDRWCEAAARSTPGIYATPLFSCTYTSRWWWGEGRVLVNHALTVGLGQLRQAVVLLVRDEVGQPSEEAAAQLTLEDGVHLPEQHVLQLAGACQEGKREGGEE